ncbi:MAG: polyphenol oxidase family protein [Candidatus Rokubacteria bacterium]|nr:polyphenol oxidase family protein [Candidatus Rokubacteria bacterium]
MSPGLRPHGEPPAYFTFAGLEALGLPHATTTRRCPGMAPFSAPAGPFTPEAGRTLAQAGLDLSRVAYARQVHGAEVARAAPGGGLAGQADILVTAERAVPLAIFTADCLAMTLWDADARALALAHVGWRGTVRGATQAAVAALVGLGARPERVRVAIAPSIGPCCYEVDEPVTSGLASAYPRRWERWVVPARPGHVMLDLWTANEELLRGAGIDPANIENPRVCTACRGDLFYSYRKGHRGRLATLAALP